jgi:hypothetical protein
MPKRIAAFLCLLAIGVIGRTQAPTPADSSVEKPRVFITDSESWEMEASAAGTNGTFAAHSHGGARPQTAEIIKTFGEKCPSVTVNNLREKAAYIVVLDHEGGKGALRHKNKVAVFDAHSGDSIVSKSTLSLGGSVEEACRGIVRHWADHKLGGPSSGDTPGNSQTAAHSQPAGPAAVTPASPAGARLSISSMPEGADIEIDGAFVGNAPSSIELLPGDHKVVIKKGGYRVWERTLKVSAGDVSIKAELERN